MAENEVKKGRVTAFLDFGADWIVLICFVSFAILSYTLWFVDKVPYYSDTVENLKPEWVFDEAGNTMSALVDLDNADVLDISFEATGKKDTELTVDLYDENSDYDEKGMELGFTLSGEKQFYHGVIPYYRTDHPESCLLRFASEGMADTDISGIVISKKNVKRSGNALAGKVRLINGILFVIFGLLLVLMVWYRISFSVKSGQTFNKKIKAGKQTVFALLFIIISVTVILCFLYRSANIFYPLVYTNGDDIGVYYLVKLIDENGPALVGNRAGGISGADMYDYPYSDLFSFILVKLISLFSDNAYFTINIFYFICFYLIALVSFLVAKGLGLHTSINMVVSLLYAFCPYIQHRYRHMWLVPYLFIPVVCYICILTMRMAFGTEEDDMSRGRYCRFLFLCFCCAFTGMYYAYFACALFAVTFVVLLFNFNKEKRRQLLYPIGYIGMTIWGVIVNVLPNLVYYRINGSNPKSEAVVRLKQESDLYSFRLVQLLLPQSDHRIGFFRVIAEKYKTIWPLVSENRLASLGVVASIGFLLSLALLFRKKNEHAELSYINIAVFCIATIGGVNSLIALLINNPIRAYNRMSLIIMFISLLQIAVVLELIRTKVPKAVFYLLLLCVLSIGLFDQTFTYEPRNYEEYENDRDAIKEIEKIMPEGAMIFQLPYNDWPTDAVYKNFIGYIESKDLRWSFGCMQGREEAEWQKRVSGDEVKKMVEQLRSAGYEGLFLNSRIYESTQNGSSAVYIDDINRVLGKPDVVSREENIVFWKF